jgi:Family of unknown function (DUF6247)
VGWVGHTRLMATGTVNRVERTGPAIRAVLGEHAPAESARFESELRQALTQAGGTLDLSGVEEVMARWHAVAVMIVNPLGEAEQAQVRRARSGDYHGLRARDERGNWATV